MRRGLSRWLVLLAAIASSALASAASAHATRTPTLGRAGVETPYGMGFGAVRPRLISYGGDPLSFVNDVRWSAWGGRRAVGTGSANWDFPGWDVASGSVAVEATVIAFDRGRCNGRPVYKRVEWFFKSRGNRFSTEDAGPNLCNGKYPPFHNVHPRHCAQAQLNHPLAVAEKIMTYDGLTCRAVRAFLPHAPLPLSYRRPIRVHVGGVHGWWCGSQIGGAPRDFACDHGNRGSVEFEVYPAGA